MVRGDLEGDAGGGDSDLIPESGRCAGGNVNPLQYSCLGNPMGRRAWQATVHEVTMSQTRLNFTFNFFIMY